MTVQPEVDTETKTIYAKKVRLTSDTSSALADVLVEVLDLPIVRTKVAKLIRYDFSNMLTEGVARANAAFVSSPVSELNVAGELQFVAINDLMVRTGVLTIEAEMRGQITVKVGEVDR